MIRFTVWGVPQQRGSKQAVTIPNRKTGGVVMRPNGKPLIVAKDANPKSKDWMASVAQAAAEVYQGELLDGPVNLAVTFRFPRPKNHYRTGKHSHELKPSAPLWHASTPDLAKLVRCLEDAISGIIWRDDKQVVSYQGTAKVWTSAQACAEVVITRLDAMNPCPLELAEARA